MKYVKSYFWLFCGDQNLILQCFSALKSTTQLPWNFRSTLFLVQKKKKSFGKLKAVNSVSWSFACLYLTVLVFSRYPTNKWIKLGTFHARDERNVQSFPLDEQMYAKYVKVTEYCQSIYASQKITCWPYLLYQHPEMCVIKAHFTIICTSFVNVPKGHMLNPYGTVTSVLSSSNSNWVYVGKYLLPCVWELVIAIWSKKNPGNVLFHLT